MTPAEVRREAGAVAAGVVLGLLVAYVAAGLSGEPVWGIAAMIVVPVAVCALALEPRTSRGIVPAVSVAVGLEVIAVAVLLGLFWTPGT